MGFSVTLVTVAVMLLYAVPGYLLIKTKLTGESSIPAFAKLLMYAAQPCLTVYSFQKVAFSWNGLSRMGIFFVFTLLLECFILCGFYTVFRKKQTYVKYRVCTVAACFGNVAFMGVPLVEALLPDYPDAVIFSNMFFLSMSLLGWTAASAIISRDTKYISIKKVLLNPAVLSLAVALPLYLCRITLPAQLMDVVTVMGKMTTPLCMIVMGMRLATMKIKPIFTGGIQYLAIAVKQLLMPLFAFLLTLFLPLDAGMKTTLVLLCACPVASVVLNFAEMLGEGQDTAANSVLLGTLFSVVTIPLISLLPIN